MTTLGSETNRKLRDMGAACLVDAIEAQDDGLCMGMTFVERMQMATDEAHSAFAGRKVEQLITLRNPYEFRQCQQISRLLCMPC